MFCADVQSVQMKIMWKYYRKNNVKGRKDRYIKGKFILLH